jgi:hypothetical protein
MISLRVLGYASGLPLAPLAKLYRFIHFGFWMAAVSGLVLVAQNATNFLVMPIFYFKLLAIAIAVLVVRKLRTVVFGSKADMRNVSGDARIWSAVLLTLWGLAILAGRLTAYAWSPIGWQSTIAVVIAAAVVLAALRIGGGHRVGSEKPAGQAKVRASTGY